MAPQPNNGHTVRVDPDALIDKGKKLAELPSAPNGLFEILTKLSDNLQRLGQPWGEDKLGKQFSEGAEGYLSAKDSVVGNASTGSDASGAVPVYGQLLVNYGRTLEEAGKVFASGEDLFAEWILKNYIDEDAKGDPGPYKGPLSSDPNYGKKDEDSGKNGPSGPPPPPPGGYQGPGDGGPEIKMPSGGDTGPGAYGAGPGTGGTNAGDLSGPPVANYSTAGMSGPNSPLTLNTGPGQGNSGDLYGGTGALPSTKGTSLNPDFPGGVPGVLGPNAYKPAIDPVTGAPLDKSGGQGGGKGGGLGGTMGSPSLRAAGAFDGEKLANKNGQNGTQARAAVPGTGMMPGVPGGGMPPGNQGGAAGEGKEKRRDRRKASPQVDEQADTSDSGDPWQRSGWRTGDR
ncbi:hypothetical protein [Nocardia lijiangensis]|uniref:hypothetical protein n=1 Tax=Nocardia lijiangensis TaxID=299618 RepID=UPI00082A37A7|nr:hypothetical protein [Nocardia lijiangensis]